MPEQTEEMIALIDEATDRAARMLDELRNQTRETPLKLDDVDISELIQRALREASVPRRIQVTMDIDRRLSPIPLDEMKVMRVLSNLIRNAVEAMQDGGVLRLEAKRERRIGSRSLFIPFQGDRWPPGGPRFERRGVRGRSPASPGIPRRGRSSPAPRSRDRRRPRRRRRSRR